MNIEKNKYLFLIPAILSAFFVCLPIFDLRIIRSEICGGISLFFLVITLPLNIIFRKKLKNVFWVINALLIFTLLVGVIAPRIIQNTY